MAGTEAVAMAEMEVMVETMNLRIRMVMGILTIQMPFPMTLWNGRIRTEMG